MCGVYERLWHSQEPGHTTQKEAEGKWSSVVSKTTPNKKVPQTIKRYRLGHFLFIMFKLCIIPTPEASG